VAEDEVALLTSLSIRIRGQTRPVSPKKTPTQIS
jgi:hypothetical protein